MELTTNQKELTKNIEKQYTLKIMAAAQLMSGMLANAAICSDADEDSEQFEFMLKNAMSTAEVIVDCYNNELFAELEKNGL